MRKMWKAVEALDNKVPAQVQYDMNLRLMELVRLATLWFVRNAPKPLGIADTVDGFGPEIAEVWDNLAELQTDQARADIAKNGVALSEAGVPEDLAQRIGGPDLVARLAISFTWRARSAGP